MFTGLCQGTGKIKRKTAKGQEYELQIEADFKWDNDLEIGESIAVSGTCLTVTSVLGQRGFKAFASAETMSRTILGETEHVNLERALALGSRLGGHLVSGHVDEVGSVISVTEAGLSLIYSFGVSESLRPFIIAKGSIAIDGVSLTVNEVSPTSFTVNIIPHTADITTLGRLKAGDKVNLESDLIGKYVHSFLKSPYEDKTKNELNLSFLAEHGFIDV